MTHRLHTTLAAGITASVLLLAGCESADDEAATTLANVDLPEGVVARVDSESITVDELREFRGEPSQGQEGQESNGAESVSNTWRQVLNTMVEMKMMLLEAREMDLQNDPEFIHNFEDRRIKVLVADYLKREVKDKINLPQDQLLEDFKKSKWSRLLKLAYIRVETDEEADAVGKALEQGRPFADVAREFSTDARAPQGGLLGPYFGRGNMADLGLPFSMADEVFDLKVGEHSRIFAYASGFEVLQVVNEKPAPDHYAVRFAQTQIALAFKKGRQDLVAQLGEKYDVRLDHDVLSVLIQRAEGFEEGEPPDLTKAEKEMIFCRFEGGQLTLQDFVDAQADASYPVKYDSSGTVQFATKFILVEPLLSREALRTAGEPSAEETALTEKRKVALLIQTFKEKQVDERVDLSDARVREFYDNNLDRFMLQEEYDIVEILVASESEANDLLQKIGDGDDMQELAKIHTIRDNLGENPGRLHLHLRQRGRYGNLVDEVAKAPVGALTGPVVIQAGRKEGYSLFKVLEKTPAAPRPFEGAARQASRFLKGAEEERLLEELFNRLWRKYRSRIAVDDQQLAVLDQ